MQPRVTVVNLADLEWEAVSRGRVHAIRRKRLPMESAVPGATFEYSYSIVPEGYFTPRHRHNFDQIRFTTYGLQSTGHGDLGPGECGYFPEGAYYGPQAQKGECGCLVLQFQGASGEHLLSNEEMNATYHKMMAAGATFQNGVYTTHKPDGKKVNKDSYVAIWEEHEGRKLTFPKPRYREPVMMIGERFRWVPDRRRRGIETKHLMTYTEYRNEIGLLRLLPNATLEAGKQPEVELRYLLEGSVDYSGKRWEKDTYFFMPAGAPVEPMHSATGATFFCLTLPMISELAAQRAESNAKAA
ncbi:MAG TPA: hypothetical protein VE034_10205 [Burkholderiales bacterium]|nr:hypothetical protein [Burkholderiales bacterium]